VEALEHGRSLTLKVAARWIACPLFVVGAKLDRLIPYQHAERIAAEARGPVELLVVEDGGHNANNRPYRYRSRSADWMAGQLGLPRR
jgi:2,6-dihydroxypseudooxynicotine hydrolase